MRTTIFTTAFAVAILCSNYTVETSPTMLTTQPISGEIESTIKEFKSRNNVTYANSPKTFIKLRLKAADDETANALVERTGGLQILAFEKANQKTKDGLYNRVSRPETQGYEPMVKANKDDEKARTFIKGNEKKVQSLVIFAMDKEGCSFTNIVGHINPSNIDNVVKSQTR